MGSSAYATDLRAHAVRAGSAEAVAEASKLSDYEENAARWDELLLASQGEVASAGGAAGVGGDAGSSRESDGGGGGGAGSAIDDTDDAGVGGRGDGGGAAAAAAASPDGPDDSDDSVRSTSSRIRARQSHLTALARIVRSSAGSNCGGSILLGSSPDTWWRSSFAASLRVAFAERYADLTIDPRAMAMLAFAVELDVMRWLRRQYRR